MWKPNALLSTLYSNAMPVLNAIAVLNSDLDERPALRGTLHMAAAAAAVAGAVWLLLLADTATGYVGAAVFGTSLILLYFTSATYHQIAWNDTLRGIAQRVDHAMIFVLIAGTYTPFCLGVSLAWGIPLLVAVWGFAAVGVLVRVIWTTAPRWLGVAMYLGLGWIGAVGAFEAVSEYTSAPMALLLSGALLYTLGGLVYGMKRPNPLPRIFGFHEVFHALVVGGSVLHFAAVAAYVI